LRRQKAGQNLAKWEAAPPLHEPSWRVIRGGLGNLAAADEVSRATGAAGFLRMPLLASRVAA